MALGIEKYKDALLAAWKDVLDDKTTTNWVLFSYEGQTNDLKVISKGDGGIEEMREDLNSGKIMYAFCKVLDPKTSLNKFVLVNWQGEGAPHPRKATSANHIRDVTNLLKGTHVTVNARNEEEVDTDIIMEKLSKATASVYSFKDRGETIKESVPVGTSYKRVIPHQEINSNERDKFWQKEEEEEKKRQEVERKNREEEKRKLENEVKKRETEEAAQREAKIKERSKSISVLREVEKNELLRVQAANIVEGENDLDREEEEIERKGRSEVLRRQRSQEAQALISKRTIDARAVFEQSTSAGQLLQRRASYQPQVSSATSVISPAKEKVRWPPEDPLEPELSSLSQTDLACATGKQSIARLDNVTSQANILDQKTGPVEETSNLERAQTYFDEDLNNGEILEDYENEGLRAQALYDYQAADETEISFDPGDIITRIDQIDAGWWQGMTSDGSYGLFPANYVHLLD